MLSCVYYVDIVSDEGVVMGVLRRRHGGQRHGCKWHMGVRWRWHGCIRGGLSWAASASISVSSAREQSCRVMVRLGTGAGARLWVNCSYAYFVVTRTLRSAIQGVLPECRYLTVTNLSPFRCMQSNFPCSARSSRWNVHSTALAHIAADRSCSHRRDRKDASVAHTRASSSRGCA